MLTIKALQKLLRREQTPLVSSHIVSLSLSVDAAPLSYLYLYLWTRHLYTVEQNQQMHTVKALQKCYIDAQKISLSLSLSLDTAPLSVKAKQKWRYFRCAANAHMCTVTTKLELFRSYSRRQISGLTNQIGLLSFLLWHLKHSFSCFYIGNTPGTLSHTPYIFHGPVVLCCAMTPSQ